MTANSKFSVSTLCLSSVTDKPMKEKNITLSKILGDKNGKLPNFVELSQDNMILEISGAPKTVMFISLAESMPVESRMNPLEF